MQPYMLVLNIVVVGVDALFLTAGIGHTGWIAASLGWSAFYVFSEIGK